MSDKAGLQNTLDGFSAAQARFEIAEGEADHWYKVMKKLDDAKNTPNACNLSKVNPPGRRVAGTEVKALRSQAGATWLEKYSDQKKWQALVATDPTARAKAAAAELEADHWWKVMKKLDNAIAHPAPAACDLRGIDPPNELIPANQVDARRGDASSTWLEKLDARDEIRDTELKPIQAAAGRCMAIVNSPANNPERERLGNLLAGLETIDAKIGSKPLTPDLARAKQAKLFEMEKVLFAWNDRRTQQNLPPSAEAIAMADMVQRVHQDVIAQVVEKGMPITVADSDKFTPAEDAKLQASWRALCQSKNNPSAKIVIPETVGGQLDTPEKARQFRNETLTNFARLMGSEAGRTIIDQLEKSPHQVEFAAGDEAACSYGTAGESTFATDGSRTGKGVGTGATVNMVLGAKDSDVALQTSNGNVLFAPRFIAMGHEMVHALHASRGTDRSQKDKALLPDEKWNNWEEFRTIREGKTSEQTLRAQYGLSAERFGHLSSHPKRAVPDAFKESLDTLAEIEQLKTAGKDIDDALKKRKFNTAAMTDKTKLALYKDPSVSGPIPSGWDANQLTLDQLKGIVAAKIPGRLGELGWAPYGLPVSGPGESIKNLIDTSHHHPRSALGRKYSTLGGNDASLALIAFNAATGSGLFAGADANWPSKVEALDRAGAALDALAAGVADPTFPGKYAAKKKVADKMALLQEALTAVEKAARQELDETTRKVALAGEGIMGIDDDLRSRKWGGVLAKLNARTKLALYNDKTALGELPAGWEPNHLTLDQIKGIVKDNLPFKLAELGWSPAELRNMARLKRVTATSEAHPKSPAGARFTALGGAAALEAVANFNGAMHSKLPLGDSANWPSQLKALETAVERLPDLSAMISDEQVLRVVFGNGPLMARLKALEDGIKAADAQHDDVAESIERQGEKALEGFDPADVEQLAETGKAKGSPFEKVVRAMKEAADLLAPSGSSAGGGNAALAALETVEAEAEKFLADPANKKPSSSDGKARVAQCRVALQRAQIAIRQFHETNDKAPAILEFIHFQLERRVDRAIPSGARQAARLAAAFRRESQRGRKPSRASRAAPEGTIDRRLTLGVQNRPFESSKVYSLFVPPNFSDPQDGTTVSRRQPFQLAPAFMPGTAARKKSLQPASAGFRSAASALVRLCRRVERLRRASG